MIDRSSRILPFVLALGCSSEQSRGNTIGPSDVPSPSASSSADPAPPMGFGGEFGGTRTDCTGLACKQGSCPTGSTSITGTVYDPAGLNPLYDVVVYVPNAPLAPLPTGASCDSCSNLYSGTPIASALTDASGHFSLLDAPIGNDIPLVIQIGKWRRVVTIPTVTRCLSNPQPDGSLRLPRNRSEGDIPSIAISTGGADTLECLLRRVGVDASEYVGGIGDQGRIHIFRGAGTGPSPGGSPSPDTSPPAPESAAALWGSQNDLMKYDIVLLSCEGQETQNMNQQALHDYADAGGRLFASHFHYSWFNTGPYASENLATWAPGTNDMGDINATIVTTLSNGQPFVKGRALQDWLANVRALTNGALRIEQARHNADVTPAHTHSQAWIVSDQASTPPGATEYFSFNTPTNRAPSNTSDMPTECGRVVYSDLHVGAAANDSARLPVPTGCTPGRLSAQEKALEFMLFDLSSCVTTDKLPPPPPPPPRKLQ